MIAVDATIARLQTARELLLAPYGLDESTLLKALKVITEHRVDDADLYFQFTRSEGWSLEEGIVKSGSFSIDQGVGVRAIAGEKVAFAYSDDISEAALLDAARTVRTIASAGQSRKVKVGEHRVAPSRSLYPELDPIATLDSAAKVALLEKAEGLARAKDPRVVQVMAGLGMEYDVVLVARADGTLAADVRPLVRLSLTVIAEQDGRREVGSSGGGGRYGLAYFTDDLLQQYVDQAVHAAIVNLEARPAPAGEMTVVLGSGWPGILLHEAATAWRAISTARAPACSPAALVSAWPPRASPCSTTAPSPTAADRSTSTTKARPPSAPSSSKTASCAATSRTPPTPA